jgi:hypothetical protein
MGSTSFTVDNRFLLHRTSFSPGILYPTNTQDSPFSQGLKLFPPDTFGKGISRLPKVTKRVYIIPVNQPFDCPRSKARGLLRVDTEWRFSARPKGWGLAASKYRQRRVAVDLVVRHENARRDQNDYQATPGRPC